MRFFRSKSNLVFGIIFFSVITLCEIPMIIGLFEKDNIALASLLLLIIPFVASFVMFVVGMQTININEKGVALEVFFIPLKELAWDDVNEAGTGVVKLSKDRYLRQLYVSKRKIKESELEDMDRLRFQRDVIWFDYSVDSQKKLAFYLGMTDSID